MSWPLVKSASGILLPRAAGFSLDLGSVAGLPVGVQLPEELLFEHVAIFGGTGKGKSRLNEQICRQLALNGRGYCYLDVHGENVENQAAWLAGHWGEIDPCVRRSVHYLEAGPDLAWAYDPFEYRGPVGRPGSPEHYAYRCWLDAAVDRVKVQIIRKQGEANFEGMPRLSRWLGTVCYACAVATDERGTHLGLPASLALLNPAHPRHEGLFGQVAPHLPPDVLADFLKLRAEQRAKDQEAWVESTVNRLAGLLKTLVASMLAAGRPSFSPRRVIAQNGIVLVNLRQSKYLSQDAADTLGGLLISDFLAAVREETREEREQRNPFYLIIDEAERFIADDLRAGLGELRKMRLPICFSVQDLSCLRKGDLDLVPKALSQPGVRITFQQQLEQDARELAGSLCLPNLDETRHVQTVDRPDGYDWVPTESRTEGSGKGKSKQHGHGAARSEGHTRQRSLSETRGTNWQRGHTWQLGHSHTTSAGTGYARNTGGSYTRGTSTSVSDAETQSHVEGGATSETTGESHQAGRSAGEGVTTSPDYRDTKHKSDGRTESSGTSRGRTDSRSSSDAEGQSHTETAGQTASRGWTWGDVFSRTSGEASGTSLGIGGSASRGGNHALTAGESEAVSRSLSRTETWSEGESEQESRSVTRSLQALSRTREEVQDTGKFLVGLDDQLVLFAKAIRTLKRQHCVVALSCLDVAFPMRVADVEDPFEDRPLLRAAFLRQLKRRVAALHRYYFVPHEAEPAALRDREADVPAVIENPHFS